MGEIVKKIVLDVDGKSVELTIEQAEQLFLELRKMFGENTVYVPQYVPITTPPNNPYNPFIYWYWQPTCIGDSITYTWSSSPVENPG